MATKLTVTLTKLEREALANDAAKRAVRLFNIGEMERAERWEAIAIAFDAPTVVRLIGRIVKRRASV